MSTFVGKVALVTGATSGIGREVALAFARAGAKLVIMGRRPEAGAETLKLLSAAGSEATLITGDVSREEDIIRAVAAAEANYGGLDIAFNNAGIEHGGPISKVSFEDYRRIFDTNVWGVLAAMKHEIPAMRRRGGGSIVNTSSVAGHRGMAGVSVYVGSKHAVEGMTRATALEVAAEKIRVNAVAPALIDTEMADRFAGTAEAESRKALAARHPIGRSGTVSEVASAVLWLASDASSFVTGHSLLVDGGWTA
jgi:NAD(P)-dependent dehydrogenase (short-subunit alcohol dehydrogenase family)